ncbi:MAG: GNAT family N-acetyltransferase [Bacteroidota bacterium]
MAHEYTTYSTTKESMTLTKPNLRIEHDAGHHLFYVKARGGNAEIEYEKHSDKYLDLTHTYVPMASRGFGIASTLAEHVLNFAIHNQYQIRPSCPFIQDFIKKNPKYKSLII